MKTPTREEFVEAAVGGLGVTPEDAGKMYDLLTGPGEHFAMALTEWGETVGREIAGPPEEAP